MDHRLIQSHDVEYYISFAVAVDAVHGGDSCSQPLLWSGDEHWDLISCPDDLMIRQEVSLKGQGHPRHCVCKHKGKPVRCCISGCQVLLNFNTISIFIPGFTCFRKSLRLSRFRCKIIKKAMARSTRITTFTGKERIYGKC